MGSLEKRNSELIRKSKIQHAILSTLKISGLIAWAVLAPNTITLLKPVLKNSKRNTEKSIYYARKRLIEKGLIETDGQSVRLTKKGEIELQRLEIGSTKIQKPKKWDKKWRILIFDIPESKRTTRNKLRNTLMGIGCRKIQNSVWVTPYNCEDIITLLKTDFKIGKELIYIIADHIENDVFLRKYFELPFEGK